MQALSTVAVKDEIVYDVVVYGSSGAGIAAATQAARLGLKTLLIEPGPRIGGMTTGGLGATDIGDVQTIGGFAREFYRSIYSHYLSDSAWSYESREDFLPRHPYSVHEPEGYHFFFEPSVALKVANGFLARAGAEILQGSGLDREAKVRMQDGRLHAIQLVNGWRIRARYFVDASYEGDLMAAANVPYVIGREGNLEFGETLNGFLPHAAESTAYLDPYRIPGDPDSGLLPGIEQWNGEKRGDADDRVQAYNFRLCLTNVPDNRIQIWQPDNYEPLQYELLARHIIAKADQCNEFPYFKLTPVPNLKTDSNNMGIFSTDFVGGSHDWATSGDTKRRHLWSEHRDYTLGLLWFLGNDDRIPEDWRREVSKWGLARDEFIETDHWPPQLYVREARRMRSDYVITEADCRGIVRTDDPVALGSYHMDSHQVSRYVDAEGRFRIEGGFWQKCDAYPISYRAIIPPRGSCGNIAVPVCLSATHAAFGSARMEPVFMMLGQAAALAIENACRDGVTLQEVDYQRLHAALTDAGAVLENPQAVQS